MKARARVQQQKRRRRKMDQYRLLICLRIIASYFDGSNFRMEELKRYFEEVHKLVMKEINLQNAIDGTKQGR